MLLFYSNIVLIQIFYWRICSIFKKKCPICSFVYLGFVGRCLVSLQSPVDGLGRDEPVGEDLLDGRQDDSMAVVSVQNHNRESESEQTFVHDVSGLLGEVDEVIEVFGLWKTNIQTLDQKYARNSAVWIAYCITLNRTHISNVWTFDN